MPKLIWAETQFLLSPMGDSYDAPIEWCADSELGFTGFIRRNHDGTLGRRYSDGTLGVFQGRDQVDDVKYASLEAAKATVQNREDEKES